MRNAATWLLVSAGAWIFASMSGCGGKVYDPGESEAGAGGAVGGSGGSTAGSGGATGGSGGTVTGGSGGAVTGGSGGSMTGGSGGGTSGGSGGYPGGSGGGPAGSGGGPAGSGGGPGGSGGSAGGSCWSYLPPFTECRECMDMNCCGEVIACFEDPAGFCPKAVECFENCPMGDPMECASMCDDGNFDVAFNDLIMCGASNCPNACMNTDPPPPPPDCPVQSGSPPCDECINTQCGDECMACVGNDDCMELLYCLSDCYDDACQQECLASHPGGVNDLLAFLGYDGCLANNCANECGF